MLQTIFSGSGYPTTKQLGSVGGNNVPPTLNGVFEYDNIYGFSSIGFYLIVPTGGAVAFEVSFDGVTWTSARMRGIEADEYTSTTNLSGNFIGSISCARKFRVRTTLAGSGAGSIIGTISNTVSTLEGIEQGNRPDSFGNTGVHKDFEFTTQQTNTIIWTPSVGKRFVVTDIMISATTAVGFSIFDETNATGKIVYKANFTNQQGISNVSFRTPFVSILANNNLRITTSASANLAGVIHGYEIT